ncbi:MAG: hypothetical protein R2787_07110 [Saprospiraceae bacterium]
MKQTIHAIGWSLIFLLGSLITQAQTTVLEGRVIDAGTGQGLAYVNIGLIGTSTGTVSDQEGIIIWNSRPRLTCRFGFPMRDTNPVSIRWPCPGRTGREVSRGTVGSAGVDREALE